MYFCAENIQVFLIETFLVACLNMFFYMNKTTKLTFYKIEFQKRIRSKVKEVLRRKRLEEKVI